MRLVLALFGLLPSLLLAQNCGLHTMYGAPQGADQFLCRIGYAAGYNHAKKVADWVAYSITRASVYNDHQLKRRDSFKEDAEIASEFQSTRADYKNSGYDRGHLAPNAAIDFAKPANVHTFLMSNMAPQLPGFNRDGFGKKGAWGALEGKVRKWIKTRQHLYIIAGPIYNGTPPTIGNGVAAPPAFFKIVMNVQDNNIMAFILPHEENKRDMLASYLTSVDEIESRTGYDFFADIPDERENLVESGVESGLW